MKKILNGVAWSTLTAINIYIFIGVIWYVFSIACMQEGNICNGGDILTRTVSVIYSPIIALF